MSNLAKNADYSSDEEDEESDSEEEEQPKVVKNKIDAKMQGRHPQDEEDSSEEEEDSDTDNDAQRFITVQREGKTTGAAKEAIPNNPVGKRGRDGEGKDDEPASKRSKESKGDKGRASVKSASPSRSSRADPSSKGGKAPVSKTKPEKVKQVSVEGEEITKASTGSKKRKASPPLVNGSSKQKAEVDKSSPLKPKTPFMWTNNLEVALATMLWNDKKHGRPIPSGTKNDPYWTTLVKELSSEGVVITETQLSEKVRRMKKKWKAFKDKEMDNPWKNNHEQKLFGIWESIWGTAAGLGKQPARPATSQVPPNEEDEEEESSEEVLATPAVRASRGPVQPNRKEDSSVSESESEEEEEAPEVGPKKGGTSHDGTTKEGAFSPTAVVSPFVSKPRLEYTPVVLKDDIMKASRKGEDGSIAEQSGAEASADEEDRDGRPEAVVELLSSLKKESFSILQEIRSSCLEALTNIRKETTTVLDDMKDVNNRLGVNMPTSGMWRMNGGSVPSVDRGSLDEFLTNTLRSRGNGVDSSQAAELKTHWRQLRAEEMDLLEKRVQLTLKQLQLARKEFEEQEI